MKGLRLYLIGSALLLVAYLLAQYYKETPTDWTVTFGWEDKIPFGNYILREELPSIFPKATVKSSEKSIYNTLFNQGRSNSSYLFIRGTLHLDKPDYRELIKFVEEGNNVFIAAYDPGERLSENLELEIRTATIYGDQDVSIYFVNQAFKGEPSYYFDKGIASRYFSKVDTARATVLGKNENGDANFIRYDIGKGSLYLTPNPQLFTNYGLLSRQGASYAEKALSQLPVPQTLIIDNYQAKKGRNLSPLHVIFEHDALRWAYFITILSIVFFVLFEMKRRQRIIPVVEPLRNSSVDFVKVVGRVYYQQRDNRDIAQKKISYFLEFIRSTYRLKTPHTDVELAEVLIAKSGVSEQIIHQLFNKINELDQRGKVTDQQLIDLNKLIEKFHLQAH